MCYECQICLLNIILFKEGGIMVWFMISMYRVVLTNDNLILAQLFYYCRLMFDYTLLMLSKIILLTVELEYVKV